MRVLLLGLMLVFAGIAGLRAQTEGESGGITAEQAYAETSKLKWIRDPGEYTLPLSHAIIRLPKDYSMLAGEDAARYDLLWNGIDSRNTEAIVFNDADNTLGYFIYEESGHVAEDDWGKVNANFILRQLKAADVGANEARRKAGLDEFTTGNWKQAPRYDARSKTAVWAYELSSAKANFISSMAIRLSRTGYHQIVWVADVSRVADPAGRLNELIAMLDHEPGYGYADFVEGDKRADYGVGALAATLLNVKLEKGGLIAKIRRYLDLETLIGLAVLIGGGIFGWTWLRRRRA